jgi:catechol 2,3-dioxygenase-like lactoylglutathione lyase family enzyme
MPTLRQATPFLLVPNFKETVAFFTDILGFGCPHLEEENEYAFVQRDGVGVRILIAPFVPIHRSPDLGHSHWSFYVDVDDVDALFEELKDRLATLPHGDFTPPEDYFYGQREMRVRAPHGRVVVFGQAVKEGG